MLPKNYPLIRIVLVWALLALVSGCKREAGPPPPLPADQISAEFQKTYQKSPPEAKPLISIIEKALAQKDYQGAFFGLQKLAAVPDLTQPQQALIGRAMLTVNGLLELARNQGDASAAATLNTYRSSR